MVENKLLIRKQTWVKNQFFESFLKFLLHFQTAQKSCNIQCIDTYTAFSKFLKSRKIRIDRNIRMCNKILISVDALYIYLNRDSPKNQRYLRDCDTHLLHNLCYSYVIWARYTVHRPLFCTPLFCDRALFCAVFGPQKSQNKGKLTDFKNYDQKS